MPAFMRSARSRISTSSRTGSPTRSATRSTRTLRPDPISVLAMRASRGTISTRGSRRLRAIISIASSTAAPRSALERMRAWGVSVRSTPRRCTQAAQALIGKHDFTTFRSDRMPGQVADQDARPARRLARRRDHRASRLGALLPAQSGPLDGRLAEARGRGQMARQMNCGRLWRPATAAPAERSRRRKASISSRSTIKPTASRCRAFIRKASRLPHGQTPRPGLGASDHWRASPLFLEGGGRGGA